MYKKVVHIDDEVLWWSPNSTKYLDIVEMYLKIILLVLSLAVSSYDAKPSMDQVLWL